MQNTLTLKAYDGSTRYVMKDTSRDNLLTDFGKTTLSDRYLVEGESYQDRFAVVAAYYSDNSEHAQRMYDYISRLWLMPSTPILGNGGTEKGMPISCFLNNVDDTIASIINNYHETAWLSAMGGGTGTNWSDVRSIGEPIRRVGKSGGVIPFICLADSNTIAISQGSLRRGSNAAYLDMSHPEIEEFIHIRKPTGGDSNRKALNIHHGVCVSDAFMNAVDSGSDWDLVSPHTKAVIKTVKARDLWAKLLDARISLAEPYLFFVDTANRNKSHIYKKLNLPIKQSNLCAEIALTTGEDHLKRIRTAVCCLLSWNLEYFDDWNGNRQFAKDTMIFLDNVLTDFINRTEGMEGFEHARYAAHRERSIGLGVMGYHSYMQKNNIAFESAMAVSFTRRAFGWIKNITSEINTELAIERGSCPDAIDAGFTQRFTHVTAVAPTASISIIAANTSPGIEPFISNSYTQKTLSGSFGVKNRYLDVVLNRSYDKAITDLSREDWLGEVWSSITVNQGSVQHLPFLSDHEKAVFKTAFEIDNEWIIELASHYAPYIDQAVSINLFLDPDISKAKLHKIHFKAWKKGIKSLYYLRSKSLRRAEVVSHMAGTMANEYNRRDDPRVAHTVTLDYDECLACQ